MILCALLLYAACDRQPPAVRGVIIEVTDRNLAEIETLRIRDSRGQIWTFTTDAPLEKNGPHLRLHQTLGQTIEVRYEPRGDVLVAILAGLKRHSRETAIPARPHRHSRCPTVIPAKAGIQTT